MIAYRRTEWNFSLERAVAWARQLGKPLLVFEPLNCDYRWASDRFHAAVIAGMAANARRLSAKPVAYYPYLEPKPGAGQGLLACLAARACVVVSDDYPGFFLPRLTAAAAKRIPVRFELIDSNGILPLRAAPKVYRRAFDFRRFLQNHLPAHLLELPVADPLFRLRLPRLAGLPSAVRGRWPAADLSHEPDLFKTLPIDHTVPAVSAAMGAVKAQRRLRQFLEHQLPDYDTLRNQPQQDVASGLSAALHFGHLSAHQVLSETLASNDWSPTRLSDTANGSNTGWWGASPAVEAFLDQLVTWRELGFNMAWQQPDYTEYDSLPDWARTTLDDHASDRREHLYRLDEFETAATHDELWNAAQRQLVREGRIHNYLRMLWGKKILEWTASPQEAFEVLVQLNNRYALDGRDPNSYSGIGWVLGRYDRAWGPERPVFGKIRYMSSRNTARKVRVAEYLKQYSAACFVRR